MCSKLYDREYYEKPVHTGQGQLAHVRCEECTSDNNGSICYKRILLNYTEYFNCADGEAVHHSPLSRKGVVLRDNQLGAETNMPHNEQEERREMDSV